ncbi:mechanosensitive ion channel family protein [Pseudomonadota bacterium]
MSEFLEYSILQNSIQQWITAIVIIVGTLIFAKLAFWALGGLARQLTKKSKTKLDDIIIDLVEEPAVVILILFGIWTGINTLSLPVSLQEWVGKVAEVLVVLCITWLIARLFKALFQNYVAPLVEKSETDLDDQILPIVQKTLIVTIWAFGIIIGLNNAGYDVGALIAGLGIGGLALAMAAKDSVSNIFGGLTVLMDHPFKLGDRIKVSGFDGTVKEIGIRTTRLETLDGRIVSIPNATFSGTPVENISLEPSRKITSNLGLTYDTSAEKMQEAMDLLRQIVKDSDNVEEKCTVAFNQFGDSAMNIFFIYYITKGKDIAGTQTEMNMEILKRFGSAGLDFAYPTQMLYAKTVD